jgi:hypothetical protein
VNNVVRTDSARVNRMLLYACVPLAVALLHPTGKPRGTDSAVAGETLEDIQSVWDVGDRTRTWSGGPRACPI